MRGIRRALGLAGLVLVAFVAGAGGASASPAAAPGPRGFQFAEQIVSWDVRATIAADGVVRFDETLVYDFGTGGEFHGIYREVLDQQRYDDRYDRRSEDTLLDATADGAPVRTDVSRVDHRTRLRLGDPDVLVSGVGTGGTPASPDPTPRRRCTGRPAATTSPHSTPFSTPAPTSKPTAP